MKKYNGHFMEETGEQAQRDPLHKTVYAIGSVHCASVELIVNGKSKGVVRKPDHAFVYAFPNVDITESGTAEVVARDKAGKEIARHVVRSFVGDGVVEAKVMTGPKGWLADGSDIAVVDFSLVDANRTIHPYASNKLTFSLSFEPATSHEPRATNHESPTFMGGWNSGVFGEASPIGKDFVNLECGMARVFVKAGRRPGKVTLKWKMEARSEQNATDGRAPSGRARTPAAPSGEIVLELKPFEVSHGLSAAPQQASPANRSTFARKTSAEAVQDLSSSGAAKAVPYTIRVNGVPVAFAKGRGEPVKPDDNTGVCCAFEPVLAALKAAGAELEYIVEPKRIPPNKKWLRKLSPTPFVPMVTVKAGGHEIDACAGFTELFIDNGKDKNLTNCEIYGVGKKNAKTVCGELAALVGYIPGVKIEIDERSKTVKISVSMNASN